MTTVLLTLSNENKTRLAKLETYQIKIRLVQYGYHTGPSLR